LHRGNEKYLIILGGYSMLSESSAASAMHKTQQMDPVVRVQVGGISDVMVSKHLAPIVTQQAEHEGDKGL
jgi:hypothetical protein